MSQLVVVGMTEGNSRHVLHPDEHAVHVSGWFEVAPDVLTYPVLQVEQLEVVGERTGNWVQEEHPFEQA